MTPADAALRRVLAGSADAGIGFGLLRRLLLRLGFSERVRGGHHIFSHDAILEIINLQPRRGKAKPYQVKQVRQLIRKYNLGGASDSR